MTALRARRTLTALAALASAVAIGVGVPSPASAATTLTSGIPVTSSASPGAYTVTTSRPYWSVVGVKPPSGADYDLTVSPGASSLAGGSTVDFIGIDTNLCAGATRSATVNRFAGTGAYTVEFSDPARTLTVEPLPFPDHNVHIESIFGPGIGEPGHFIGVVDVYLVAGRRTELYAAHVGGSPGDVYVMAPDPARCGRAPGSALVHGQVNSGGHRSVTLTFTPTRTGWYGLIQTSYGADPQSGYSSLRIGQA